MGIICLIRKILLRLKVKKRLRENYKQLLTINKQYSIIIYEGVRYMIEGKEPRSVYVPLNHDELDFLVLILRLAKGSFRTRSRQELEDKLEEYRIYSKEGD